MNAAASLSLFERPVAGPMTPALVIELWPNQVTALERIERSWASVRATLCVSCTGSGKTTIFSEAIKRRSGRALVIAHRDELIKQAARRISRYTGRNVQIEKAQKFASRQAEVVVASVQTLGKEQRLARWPADHFGTIIIDEAHHAPADSYRRILAHFGEAKVLGVTATPDRADELAMGSVFEDVAFVYEITDGIRDGILCRVRERIIDIQSIDLSDVATVAGDLSADQLDAVMSTEENLHKVVRAALGECGERKTMVFTTSVANAHRMAEIFRRYKPDCARAVDGTTEARERARHIDDHVARRYQYMVNVGVFTEGYDDKEIAAVVIGRPTKSRALFAQMAGRGTRIAPGKTDLLLLTFRGKDGRHSLVGMGDILAGKYPEGVVARAKEIAEEGDGDSYEAMQQAVAEAEAERKKAERELELRRRSVKAKVAYTAEEVDPFAFFGVRNPAEYGAAGRFGDGPPSEVQLEILRKAGVKPPANLSHTGARRLIEGLDQRRRDGLCTLKQAAVLAKYGHATEGVTMAQASTLITALGVAHGWRSR